MTMHCWEFHHALRGKKIEWYWRALNEDGSVHAQSRERFRSSVEAFEDAKRHGFDKELHEWYLAASGDEPCVRTRSSG